MSLRKNNGTTTMTRQRATSIPHRLGMTTGDKTLEGYLENPRAKPALISEERKRALDRRGVVAQVDSLPTIIPTVLENFRSHSLTMYSVGGTYFCEKHEKLIGVRYFTAKYRKKVHAIEAVRARRWVYMREEER